MTLPVRFAATLLSFALLPTVALAQGSDLAFITRSGGTLMEGNREFRFVSFNIPNLHLIEDNFPFDATNEWRFPDEFEIEDALRTVKQLGGRAVRTYVISIARKEGPNPIPAHVVRPGEFNEEAFVALDRVLAIANRVGVRVILPLVDNWKWWGGAAEYASYRNKPPEAFWTDPDVIADFEKTIHYVLNRRNTITGTLYKDDPAVLAWETGNELACPYSWTKQIAAYIKSQDSKHLVWDGMYIGAHEIQEEALEDPNIDIVSSHHYPGPKGLGDAMVADIVRFHKQIAGRKAYVVGEFGFIPLADVKKVVDAVIENGLTGAMIWSLRFHDRDGGFYWHSEGASGDAVKAYHYPGFETGASYQEAGVFDLLRDKAYEIQGLPVPAMTAPEPPRLLPIFAPDAISWRGSVGATGYDVERAPKAAGPWTLVGMNVDDTRVQYRPVFADRFVDAGASYYYRVRARNAAGRSDPSNVVGPVSVHDLAVVDELADDSNFFASGGPLELVRANARPYKEDASRLAGHDGAWVIYRTREPLQSASIEAFMDGDEKDFDLAVSSDGTRFTPVEAKISRFPTAVNPYGYKLPVRYDLSSLGSSNYFLRIVFKTDAQIGRVELRRSAKLQQ